MAMKKIFITALACAIAVVTFAQDITGQWNGLLAVQGIRLRIVFHIEKGETGFTGSMDSPDQNAYGIPVTAVTFVNNILTIKLDPLMAQYEGTPEGSGIRGTFKQAGLSFPMDLSRNAPEVIAPERPQEPVEPFPYHAEDLVFLNPDDKIHLAGTLTLPLGDGPFPAVVLISGSGAQNRDEEVFGHKPFKVIADHLARRGIAALRFDDRGTAMSEGDFISATSEDFTRDVLSAVAYLTARKEINRNEIGLIGHSEGGIIAPMAAAASDDVNFIVLLAGSGIPGDELLLLQGKLISYASGISEEATGRTLAINRQIYTMVMEGENQEMLRESLFDFLMDNVDDVSGAQFPDSISKTQYINSLIIQVTSPWVKYFLLHDPAKVLESVRCPVLALNGEKDLQVPPRENLSAIKNALLKSGNNQVTVVELPGLNHLFQECETGSPAEYKEIEQTFAPVALEHISEWIIKTVRK
jgi:uncharacterized protein